jgi:hypothetical protein
LNHIGKLMPDPLTLTLAPKGARVRVRGSNANYPYLAQRNSA